ncbi:unnamed protein product [Arabidopsis halleri]
MDVKKYERPCGVPPPRFSKVHGRLTPSSICSEVVVVIYCPPITHSFLRSGFTTTACSFSASMADGSYPTKSFHHYYSAICGPKTLLHRKPLSVSLRHLRPPPLLSFPPSSSATVQPLCPTVGMKASSRRRGVSFVTILG